MGFKALFAELDQIKDVGKNKLVKIIKNGELKKNLPQDIQSCLRASKIISWKKISLKCSPALLFVSLDASCTCLLNLNSSDFGTEDWVGKVKIIKLWKWSLDKKNFKIKFSNLLMSLPTKDENLMRTFVYKSIWQFQNFEK